MGFHILAKWTEFFHGYPGDYRLVMRNQDFDSLIKNHIVLSGKVGVATSLTPKGVGPQDQTKKWSH